MDDGVLLGTDDGSLDDRDLVSHMVQYLVAMKESMMVMPPWVLLGIDGGLADGTLLGTGYGVQLFVNDGTSLGTHDGVLLASDMDTW